MRWILLLAGIILHTVVISQATLKIFVVSDDIRTDMDIIDLNTSALDRYGQSVDSTNTNYYTTTMSTQVLRMSRLDLFGPEKITTPVDIEIEDSNGGSSETEIDLESNDELSTKENLTEVKEAASVESSANNNSSVQEVRKSSSKGNRSLSSKSTRSKTKRRGVKKSRKIKRYRGQCPKFF